MGDLQKDLRDAIRVSSLKLVMEALSKGADPNYCKKGEYVFVEAVKESDFNQTAFNIVREMLSAGIRSTICARARITVLSRLIAYRQLIPDCEDIPFLEATKELLDKVLEGNQVTVALPKATAPVATINLWKKLLFSKDFSDIKFTFPDGAELHAHKNVLAAASPYFDAYFKGPWGATHPNGVWKTQNPFPVMKAVLTFIYTGDLIPMGALLKRRTNLGIILSVAVQYQLPVLQTLVENKLKNSLSLMTVKDTLLTANLHASESLKVACFDFIRRNAAQVMFDPSIMAIAQEEPALWTEVSEAVSGNKRQKTSLQSLYFTV